MALGQAADPLDAGVAVGGGAVEKGFLRHPEEGGGKAGIEPVPDGLPVPQFFGGEQDGIPHGVEKGVRRSDGAAVVRPDGHAEAIQPFLGADAAPHVHVAQAQLIPGHIQVLGFWALAALGGGGAQNGEPGLFEPAGQLDGQGVVALVIQPNHDHHPLVQQLELLVGEAAEHIVPDDGGFPRGQGPGGQAVDVAQIQAVLAVLPIPGQAVGAAEQVPGLVAAKVNVPAGGMGGHDLVEQGLHHGTGFVAARADFIDMVIVLEAGGAEAVGQGRLGELPHLPQMVIPGELEHIFQMADGLLQGD